MNMNIDMDTVLDLVREKKELLLVEFLFRQV